MLIAEYQVTVQAYKCFGDTIDILHWKSVLSLDNNHTTESKSLNHPYLGCLFCVLPLRD